MAEGTLFGLLGPLRVVHAGQPIEIGTPKERQLLALLLLEPGHALSTDVLVDRLWGDAPPAKPVVSLRAYVSNLRRSLGDVGVSDAQPTIVKNETGYSLAIDPGLVDVTQFEQAIAEARTQHSHGASEAAAALVDSALELVRGEPLSDMVYVEFARNEIQRLDEMIAAARELRAALATDGHEADRWAAIVGDWVDEHPYREQLRGSHMLLLYRAGRQAEALESYQQHRSLLVEELGIEPTPALQTLEARILAHDPLLSAADTAIPAEPSGSTGGVLVGRARELSELRTAVERAPAAVVIAGEPGAGKSTLLDASLGELGQAGWRTVRGYCTDDDGVPPLWPWRQVLRDLGQVGALSLSHPGETGRYELFDQLATAILDAARTQRVVIGIDDLQWADPDTLQLLAHVARRSTTEPLVIVATTRLPGPDLVSFAHEWIELQALDQHDVVELVECLTGEECSLDLAHAIMDRTGGNPFFVVELIKLSRQLGRPVGTFDELPRRLLSVVRHRVAPLPASSLEVLEYAALEPRGFSVPVIAAAIGHAPDTVLEWLDPALAAGIVVPDAAAFERLRFDHSITREALAASGDPAERTRRHAALGKALEHSHRGSPTQLATELSRHYSLGAPAGTATDAVRWALIAADQAATTWSTRDAIVHVDRALEALDHLDSVDTRLRCQIRLRRGALHRTIGESAVGESDLLEAFRLADEIGDGQLIGDVALAYAEGLGTVGYRWWWAPGATAIAALQRAIEVVGADDPVMRARLLSQLGVDSYAALTVPERAELFDEAIELATAADDHSVLARVLLLQRIALGWSWPLDRVVAHDEDLFRLAVANELEYEELHAMHYLLSDALVAGDADAARRQWEKMKAAAGLRGSTIWRHQKVRWDMFFAQLRGDWTGVHEIATKALDPASGFGEEFADAILNQLGVTMYFQGEYAPVEAILRAGLDEADRPMFARLLLVVVASDGRHDEARHLVESTDLTTLDGDQSGGRYTLGVVLDPLAALEETEHLERLVEFVEPVADQFVLGTPTLGGFAFFGSFRYFLARALTALGRYEQAAAHIETGRPIMENIGAHPNVMQFDLAEALLQLRRDGIDRARPALEHVQLMANQLGMKGIALEAQRALA